MLRYVPKKTERQMHLVGLRPTDAANLRIKTCKQLARRLRQIDCDEEPFAHGFATLIVES
jgi:hypothetical protein